MVTKKRSSYGVEAKAFIDNPSHKDLRQFTGQMASAHITVFGNYDAFTRVDARSTASTYVLTSDYFGESKKGGLRMWNKIVYDKGGLPMHAGAKVVQTSQGPKTIVIIGLSGTGKTTSTFRRQADSKPVQDDFIALMPGGIVHGSE